MAGIGVTLNRIFKKNTLTSTLIGFTYSTMITTAPMLVIIGNVILMEKVHGFSDLSYAQRELFSCTLLYTFIFALITSSPFNAVLSRYMSDVIYEERYEDILPCYYMGLLLNVILSCLVGIPFCLWEHFIGGVSVFYVFTGFCGYISLAFVFYSMIYLSICKDYKRISLYYLIGMVWAFLLSLILHFLLHWGAAQSMLFSLMTGFLLTAVLEFALIRKYFALNSGRYRAVIHYFRKYWKLMAANFAYILGLYIHNFVFWNTDMKMVVANSFVCNQPYDMASCLAMFTNISATIIFISRVEMHFHEKYKRYTEAVIGGKWIDIEKTKHQMFRQLASELMTLVRIQFIISVIIYLIFIIVLPLFGLGGLTMKIYPCLASGYFIIFLMNSAMIFLYYFDDTTGAVLTSVSFCLTTLAGSMIATHLPEIWYGIGTVIGAFVGWTVAYSRLRWVEKNIDTHTFCKGHLMKKAKERMPSGKVYDRSQEDKQQTKGYD